MDILEAIRAKALRSVLKPDGDYHGRFVRRWYSRTFHTPLHVVDELPMLDLFEHFYECEFESMEPEERKAAIAELLLTPDQRRANLMEEAAADAGAEELLKLAAEENKKLSLEAAKPLEPLPTIPAMREPELPSPIQTMTPPDIKMVFVEEQSLLEEMDGFGTMAPPPKTKR